MSNYDENANIENPTRIPSGSSNAESSSRKRTSDVWTEFEITIVDGQRKARCKKCVKLYSCATSGGTGHLKRHVESHKATSTIHSNQTTIRLTEGSFGSFTYKDELNRKELVKWIVKDELPFSMCESKNFETYVQLSLQPSYKKCSRRTIRRVAMTNYLTMKTELVTTLSNFKGRISLTSDLWTASVGSMSFISVTAHYINDEWQMNKRILAFRAMDFPHTGVRIASIIRQVTEQYGIKDKIFSITFDNATNNDASITSLKQTLKPILDGELFHIRCACHILNLCVQAGMNKITDIICKIRDGVSFIHTSRARQQQFKELCIEHGLRFKKFRADVITRWNSTYMMIHDVYRYREVLTIFISQHIGTYINEGDWEMTKKLEDILQTFYYATNRLSGIYYPTSPCYLQQIYLITTIFCDNEFEMTIGPIISEMKDKWVRYWERIGSLHTLAAVFDPRIKLTGVLWMLDQISLQMDINVEGVKENVKTLLNKIYTLYNIEINGDDSNLVHVPTISTTQHRSHSFFTFLARQAEQAAHYEFAMSCTSTTATPIRNTTELDLYLKTDLRIAMNEDSIENLDLLIWWKNVANQYPILSKIARDILAVQMSTVASESAFSAGRRVLDEKRSRMTGETVEMLLCFKDWLDAEARNQDVGGHNTSSEDEGSSGSATT